MDKVKTLCGDFKNGVELCQFISLIFLRPFHTFSKKQLIRRRTKYLNFLVISSLILRDVTFPEWVCFKGQWRQLHQVQRKRWHHKRISCSHPKDRGAASTEVFTAIYKTVPDGVFSKWIALYIQNWTKNKKFMSLWLPCCLCDNKLKDFSGKFYICPKSAVIHPGIQWWKG